ncbi:MAG: hypothetical protein JNN29_05470 [Chitinophagaceae bacterium]|nr:hypothetical protein [Chitinophagaceae bacterium]
MKQIKSLTRLTTILTLASLLVIGCTKEKSENNTLTDTEEAQASTYSMEANAEADVVFNDVFDNVMGVNNEVGMEGTGVFGRESGTSSGSSSYDPFARGDSLNPPNRCFTVSIIRLSAPDIFPVKIIVDFGAGCQGRDGHIRSGKIITTYTGRLVAPGKKATTTFENFYFDSIHVEGTHEVTNTSTSLIPSFKIVVENAKLTKPNGNYVNWNAVRTVTQIDGMGTQFFPLDDVYKLESAGNGKVKRGDVIVAWNTETVEPLIKRFNCRWIVKGIVRTARLNLSTNSPWVARLNYGNGDCDNKAILTINGISTEITLP